MNTTKQTNYQTSFRVARENDQTIFQLKKLIFNWLKGKEKDHELSDRYPDFCKHLNIENAFRTYSTIFTSSYYGEDQQAWVLEYIHADKEKKTERFWNTHVGLREFQKENKIVVSVRISYSWNKESLSILHADAPTPSVPAFVQWIVNPNPRDGFTPFKVTTGESPQPLRNKYIDIPNVNSAKLLGEKVILSQDRIHPIIVFNGSSDAHVTEARDLAYKLAGKVQVFVIHSNRDLAETLKQSIPQELNIAFNSFRIFYTVRINNIRGTRHRFFSITDPFYKEKKESIIHALLTNHSLSEKGAVFTPDDIRRLVSRSKLDKLRAEGGAGSAEEIQLLQSLLDEAEKDLEEKNTEVEACLVLADQAESEKNRLEEEMRKLEYKIQALNSKTPITPTSSKPQITLPTNLYEVVEQAKELYPDRLAFSDTAFKEAKNSNSSLFQDAWTIFYHLNFTLYEIKYGGQDTGDLKRRFHNDTGYEYVPTEGPVTKENKKFERMRTITYNGKEYVTWPHIKQGNDRAGVKCLRIHFAFDDELKKIIIGYVGSHMDNASS